MTLRDYLAIASRWWWVVLLGCLLAATAAFVLTRQMTPIYRAEATILVNQVQNPGVASYQDILSSQQLTKTYAELATSNINLQRAAQSLDSPAIDTDWLERSVDASSVPDTQLIRVAAEDADADRATTVANTVAETFTAYIEEAQLAGGSATDDRPLNTVFVAERATTPASPVRPNLVLNMAAGVFLGLLVMMGIVAVTEYLDDDIESREDVEGLGAPFLGTIPRAHAPRGANDDWTPSLASDATDMSELAESYRQLYASLSFALSASDARTVLITSSSPGEGKSTTAANLAIALSESAKRVLLVDGDMRKPDAHRHYRLPNSSGLSSAFLAGDTSLDGFLRRVNDSLYVLTAGPIPPNPVELLSSKKMDSILEEVSKSFDIILIDSLPLIGLADASLWASRADGVLLVARHGKTRKAQLKEAMESVRATHKPLIGVVLNSAKRSRSSVYYRYGYGYSDKKPPETKAPSS